MAAIGRNPHFGAMALPNLGPAGPPQSQTAAGPPGEMGPRAEGGVASEQYLRHEQLGTLTGSFME